MPSLSGNMGWGAAMAAVLGVAAPSSAFDPVPYGLGSAGDYRSRSRPGGSYRKPIPKSARKQAAFAKKRAKQRQAKKQRRMK